MPIPTYALGCSSLNKTCSGACTGYASTCTCPPLIVLAVIAAVPHPLTSQLSSKGASHASP